jgi:pimeloyl-ACP methyl ester carboxylesterase
MVLAFAIVATACSSHSSEEQQAAKIQRVRVDVGSPPLIATLTLPASTERSPVVVLLSGSGPNDQDETIGPNKPFRDLADGLAAQGVATLRYDKRTRRFPASIDPATFTATDEYVPDAVAAVKALRVRAGIDPDRIFVLGHSQGGTFAPRIAVTDPQIAGIILLAAGAAPFGSTLLRQATYLSNLPGEIGTQARAQLPTIQEFVRQIDNPDLAPGDTLNSPLLGGTGPAYFLDLRAYDELSVARSLPQPMLILQGERDYQVTVTDEFNRWTEALAGRTAVTTHRYPHANHQFIDGTGPPSPADYEQPGHVAVR